jgi:prevent-host-death family protein
MTDTMPLAKVKAHLSEVVDRVIASHERVNLTRHGHREAVVIAADDLDALGRKPLSPPNGTAGPQAARRGVTSRVT